ncbi:MAG: PTS sorbitol transporter subunit IIC [Chloroflexi bacterium]|jgi:PTS system glucitol/sorbitol-specific IIC component|nr:PTS sorbitol transporter subunit IIC [Chloroflexota bacterium]
MEFLANLAEAFSGVFKAGGENFVGLITGIIPSMVVLMTAVNSLIRLIGPEKIDNIAKASGKEGILYYPLRYAVLPFLACFFLTNPMAYTMGRFLPEKYKIGWIDSALTTMQFPIGIFPHINAGEIFTWAGIATGVTTLGLNISDLAMRYFLSGFLVILIRGTLTERIYFAMTKKTSDKKA